MKLQFAKMHGIGNDFVVVDNMARRLGLSSRSVRRMADRRRGIGFDQLLVIEPGDDGAAAARLRIYNSDGEEVGQCGNGVRCVAVFMRDRDMIAGTELAIETGDRVVRARIHDDDSVTVDMGVPALEPEAIPFVATKRAPGYALPIDGDEVDIGAVSLGNPHAVLRVEDVEAAPVAGLGATIQASPQFPEGVNVGFMQVEDETHVRLRVCERGVGETLACGSGACAAVVVGNVRSWLAPEVTVSLTGGDLRVAWGGEGEPVWLTGPTARVFEGEIDL